MHSLARNFAPREFIDQLANETFVSPVTLTGWAKAEKDTDVLQFSPAHNCAEWISIPESLLQSIEYLGMAVCDEHRHPIVRIALAPSADEAQRALFLLLGSISTLAARRAQTQTGPVRPRFGQACHACMDRCRNAQDPVDCSYECMWGPCHDPIVV